MGGAIQPRTAYINGLLNSAHLPARWENAPYFPNQKTPAKNGTYDHQPH